MRHKIEPYTYYPEFRTQLPTENDYILVFEDNQVLLLKDEKDALFIPSFFQLHKSLNSKQTLERFLVDKEYLFSIDDMAFYRGDAAAMGIIPKDNMEFCSPNIFRTFKPEHMAYAGITACQIDRFRTERKFCGKCGHETQPSTTERAMICSECGHIEYPKISPAIITVITNGDKILLTKYAGGSYRNWALVAGFVEVGETFKGAVRREVMEEVGLKVGEIRYYKSQPWSFSDSAMIGFIAELDGDDTVTLQESELGEAKWFSRDEIPDMPTDISIGQEMIMKFKNGEL